MVAILLHALSCCSRWYDSLRFLISKQVSKSNREPNTHSFMHTSSVVNTRPLLRAAAYPCFRSSDSPTITLAPAVPPAAANSSVRLSIFGIRISVVLVVNLLIRGAPRREARHRCKHRRQVQGELCTIATANPRFLILLCRSESTLVVNHDGTVIIRYEQKILSTGTLNARSQISI